MSEAQIVGAVFVVIGAALLVGVGGLYLVALGSSKWAQTDGRIVYAEWIKDTDTNEKFRSFGSTYHGRFDVKYTYVVSGRELTGTRPWFGHSMWGWRWVPPQRDQRPQLWKVDQVVTVYYDPAHPDRSTLSRVIPHDRFRMLLVVAGVFVLAGIGAFTGRITVR